MKLVSSLCGMRGGFADRPVALRRAAAGWPGRRKSEAAGHFSYRLRSIGAPGGNIALQAAISSPRDGRTSVQVGANPMFNADVSAALRRGSGVSCYWQTSL
jgi:hypothetical protein